MASTSQLFTQGSVKYLDSRIKNQKRCRNRQLDLKIRLPAIVCTRDRIAENASGFSNASRGALCKRGISVFDPLGADPNEKRSVVAMAGAESVSPNPDSSGLPKEVEADETAKKLKIGIFFVAWWTLNVIFNIYNKKVLNTFPYPWLASTLALATGVTIMVIFWVLRIVEFPKTNKAFWISLAPVALAHTIGHVSATVSMANVAVSFTHIIKSSEPAFSVIIQSLLGERYVIPVWLSLIPIMFGCGLTAATELNFNMTGFMGAMISNIAFVFRNIFSKKGMSTGCKVGGLNYYACISILSLIYLTPFAFIVEGTQMWTHGWKVATDAVGTNIIWWIAAQSIFYHFYNQVSYMSLDEISPLTFSIGNTMKRVSVIIASIIIFRTPVSPINAVGAAIAIFGTFLYSQAQEAQKQMLKKQKSA